MPLACGGIPVCVVVCAGPAGGGSSEDTPGCGEGGGREGRGVEGEGVGVGSRPDPTKVLLTTQGRYIPRC